ncbi:MAG: hypothetical protein U9Q73_01450 [Nanoarchaeota archaeon]|nr:hypothetical protein [Nanoarchaeota archaeon]
MELQDLLSDDKIKKYHKEWNSFSGKHRLETPYNVHSGLPVIGQVFQFENKPIFRTHIFKRKLKKAFDPYFISENGYLYPYLHLTHYFFPIEQIAHVALSKLIPNYNHYLITDRFDSKKSLIMKEGVDFKETRVSIELLPNVTRGRNRFVVRGSATFYNDKTEESLQIWYLEGFGELRRYVKDIQKLKKGDTSAVEDLVRKIDALDVKHKKMLNPRDYIPKDELIRKLRNREIPEEELHDFFSYWDRE